LSICCYIDVYGFRRMYVFKHDAGIYQSIQRFFSTDTMFLITNE
jgi:hypothetical protein